MFHWVNGTSYIQLCTLAKGNANNRSHILPLGPLRPRGVCDRALHRVHVCPHRPGPAAEGGPLPAAQGDDALPPAPCHLDQTRHRRWVGCFSASYSLTYLCTWLMMCLCVCLVCWENGPCWGSNPQPVTRGPSKARQWYSWTKYFVPLYVITNYILRTCYRCLEWFIDYIYRMHSLSAVYVDGTSLFDTSFLQHHVWNTRINQNPEPSTYAHEHYLWLFLGTLILPSRTRRATSSLSSQRVLFQRHKGSLQRWSEMEKEYLDVQVNGTHQFLGQLPEQYC